MIPLQHLKTGTEAEIISVKESKITRRLLEMNLIPGNTCKMLFKSSFGDPIAISVENSYMLALRKEEAALILVEKLN